MDYKRNWINRVKDIYYIIILWDIVISVIIVIYINYYGIFEIGRNFFVGRRVGEVFENGFVEGRVVDVEM